MAKKKDKADKKAGNAGRADAVRSAVDQAFKGTAEQGAAAAETGRERAQDIVDQLAQAAGRVRDVLDELRPPTGDDLRTLRQAIETLDRRITALEQAQAAADGAPAPADAEAKPKPKGAGRSGSTTTRKAAAARKAATTRKAADAPRKPRGRGASS
jgi:ABC-type transporter Mla subunit MlaD